jgi:acyl transferase domain-containing protein
MLGSFLEGLDEFDPGLFRMPPNEAMALDPQSRMLLEQTHLALTQAWPVTGILTGKEGGRV